MQKFLKIVYWTSIFLICFWLLAALLEPFIPLEFANNEGEYVYDSIHFYGLPIVIMLTLTGTIKKKDALGLIVAKIFGTICAAAFSAFVMIATLLAGMCDWTTDRVFFENKQNPSIKIVQRSYGCGAIDSSPATLKVFKVREIAPYLIWVTNIDTSQINKSEWTMVDDS